MARLALFAPNVLLFYGANGVIRANILSQMVWKESRETANMPRRLPQDIDQEVLTHVGNSPDGLSLDELLRLRKG